MENKQYELCLEILKRFHREGILDNLVLIGSWCVYFYRDYFLNEKDISKIILKTRDIDFLVDRPYKIKQQVDIPLLLKDLGFVIKFRGGQGYIKLDHPDLILEFLVPERGKGIEAPFPLPKWGMNAVSLRFLHFLSQNIIKVKVNGFYLTLPHPVNFALHKLIISQRRRNQEKRDKDRDAAVKILRALIKRGETRLINKAYNTIPKSWKDRVIKGLSGSTESDIIEILE